MSQRLSNVLVWISFIVGAFLMPGCSREAPPAQDSAPAVKEGATSPPADKLASNDANASAALEEIVEGYFDRTLELNPIFATFIGDHRFDDRVANSIGPKYLADSLALEREYLGKIKALDQSALSGQDLLSYEIFLRNRESAIEGFKYPGHLVPISQFFSIPNFFATLGSGASVQPFKTTDDYRNWLGRIDGFAIWIDQSITNMRDGMNQKIVRPRAIMEKTLPQLAAHVVDDVEKSVFYTPINNLPDDISDEDCLALTAEYENAIRDKIIPAYRKLHDFVRDEYLPQASETVGMHAVPGGVEWYNYLIKNTTTTDLTAEQIHRIGLKEVARIRDEMEKIKDQVGFEGPLRDFFEFVKTDKQFYFDEADELLDGYRSLKDKVDAAVPELFSLIPKADFEIRAVEEFRAQSAASASYMAAAPDGSRPGVFYVNTFDLAARPNYELEAIYVHEAAPGHHFQISLQQELEELPRFRRFGGYTAYIEGWGLYAESLGPELGLYTDPYQYFGALNAEMLRAIRLVTDTGMHAKGWTREQALDYMLENSSTPETDAIAEIERYIAIPGQALAYKLGQLKISELRALAEKELGDKFEIAEFHAAILQDGALPLDVLEAKIKRWIEAQRG